MLLICSSFVMCFFVAGTGVDNCGLVFLSVGDKYDLKSFLFLPVLYRTVTIVLRLSSLTSLY